MAINYSTVFFAILLVGMECRSMVSSNLNQAVERSERHEASKQHFLPNMSGSKDFDYVINLTNVNKEFVDRSSKDFLGELSRLITTQGLSLEKLLAEFVARAANATDQEETAAQWLKQLKLILEVLSSGIQIEKSSVSTVNDIGEAESTLHEKNDNFILIGGNNWPDDLQEFLDEQYIDAENSKDNEANVKSIDQSSEETEDDDRSDQHDSEQLDDTVTEFQNDVSGIEKYFGKLCRKHRTAL